VLFAIQLGDIVRAKGGLAMASDWAKDQARRIKQQEQAKQLENTKVVQDRNQLRAETPKRWEEVRRNIQQKVSEFNAEMGREFLLWQARTSGEAVVAVKDSDRVLTCSYDENTFTIETKGIMTQPKFQAEVLNGKVVFRNPASYVISEEKVAEEVLSWLFQD
jgi:predicted nucleotidyltransferase